MTPSKLSEAYSMATTMIHDLTTYLYEDLHDHMGDVRHDPDQVKSICKEAREKIIEEISVIAELSLEYHGK